MGICVPVQDDRGLQAPSQRPLRQRAILPDHDTDTGRSNLLPNGEEEHAHGQCHPLQSIASQKVDVVLCGGIGRRAIDLLQQAGLRVCLAPVGSADAALRAYAAGSLTQLDPADACQHHSCD